MKLCFVLALGGGNTKSTTTRPCSILSRQAPRPRFTAKQRSRRHVEVSLFGNGGNDGSNKNNNNNNNNGGQGGDHGDGDHDEQNEKPNLLRDLFCMSTASSGVLASSLVNPTFEIQGAMRYDYQVQPDGTLTSVKSRRDSTEHRIVEELFLFFFPEGYPDSVGSSYLKYSIWRGLQNIVSAMTAVLSTQALLTAVGVASGTAAGVAAATNWVLKDGASQLGKIISSRMGPKYDQDSKFWRLFSDIVYDFGLSLELLTPLVPQAFLLLAAVGNFSKSVSISIGMSCRNSVLTTFVRRENLGEISAKNDAQNTLTNLTGMALGIGLARALPSDPRVRLGVFWVSTAVYSCFNYLAMKSVELRTLNRQRLGLALDSWVRSKRIPTIEEVNKYEVIIPFKRRPLDEPKTHIGVSLASVSHNSGKKLALLSQMYKKEKYILAMDPESCEMKIVLHDKAAQPDLLQAMIQAAYIRRQVISRMNAGCDASLSWTKDFAARCRPNVAKIRQKFTEDELEKIVESGLTYAKSNLKEVQAELTRMQFSTKTLLLAPDRFRARW